MRIAIKTLAGKIVRAMAIYRTSLLAEAPAFVQAPELAIQAITAARSEREPEPWSWKISGEDVSPKSSLIERVISVVFALIAFGILIDGTLERLHLMGIDALFPR